MQAVTMTSDQARIKWRETVDTAFLGGDVIIERYGKPIAVLVNYAQLQKERARLKELEQQAEVVRIRAKMADGSMGGISSEELLRLLGEKYGQDYVDKVHAYVAAHVEA